VSREIKFVYSQNATFTRCEQSAELLLSHSCSSALCSVLQSRNFQQLYVASSDVLNKNTFVNSSPGQAKMEDRSNFEIIYVLFIYADMHFILIGRNSPPPPVGQGLLIHEHSRPHSTTQRNR